MAHIEQIRQELTWKLRQKVLYPEKEIREMAMDVDHNGIHFGAFEDGWLIGVVSLFQESNQFQFRKFAIDPAYQRKGIGNQLLAYITEFAKGEAGTMIWCNARLDAMDFYLKNQFGHTGKLFSKNGHDYEILTKQLSPV